MINPYQASQDSTLRRINIITLTKCINSAILPCLAELNQRIALLTASRSLFPQDMVPRLYCEHGSKAGNEGLNLGAQNDIGLLTFKNSSILSLDILTTTLELNFKYAQIL